MNTRHIITIGMLLSVVACTDLKVQGSDAEQSPFAHVSDEGVPHFDLDEIQENGELIVLTLYGPQSYFEFRGENFGLQYMIASQFAKSIGVSVRVDVSSSVMEMLRKLRDGEGDMVAFCCLLPDSMKQELVEVGGDELCRYLGDTSKSSGDNCAPLKNGSGWIVRKDSPRLQESLGGWIASNSGMFDEYTTIRVKTSSGRVYAPRRKVSAPILNAAKGQISMHDAVFKRYSALCQWDWRLLAAQAYQESAFDPLAVSYMGAMGLMQLMPSTANEVGIDEDEVFDAAANVRGAVKFISNLDRHYASIARRDERINFILAAYNAGPGHIDDARALAKKHGKDPDVWLGNVDSFVLRMSEAEYYNQPEVKHGYFRGAETYNYVNGIRDRWEKYKSSIK